MVLAAAFGLAGGAIGLTGCETIKGVGEDVTNAGEALDDAVTGDDG
ncbi:MAG: entericidin [Phycisphaerales bacterium]